MKQRSAYRTALLILAAIAALCLTALAALLILSGAFLSPRYLEPWDREYASRYEDPRVSLAAVGLLAANNHNMQPWKIRLDQDDPTAFYLYADSSRMTREVDPFARQLMITQGAFLQYVAVAGEEKGYDVSIELFPGGDYEETALVQSMDTMPVAKIALSPKPQEQADGRQKNSALYDAIFLPDTNRGAYLPEKLSSGQTAALESLSQWDGIAAAVLQDEQSLNSIGDYAIQSAAVEAGVSRAMDESGAIFRANEYRKNRYRYGFSVEGQGTSGLRKHILQGLLTVIPALNEGSSASENFIQSARTSVANTHAYALITTSGNSRREQVESGMLYSSLVLCGHTMGLAMQPLSQVLEEYPEMDALYAAFRQEYAPGGGTVQMLVRVGRPAAKAPLSMRRSVEDLIVN